MHVWRYLYHGGVKHALLASDRTTAVCGAAPQWFASIGWYGTGSQSEYEELARRRPCKRCVAMGYEYKENS